MPIISGAVSYTPSSGAAIQAYNGATVYAWKASRFAGVPAENAAAPSGTADAGPVTSGSTYGAEGAYQITVPTYETYYAQVIIGANTAWQECQPIGGVQGLVYDQGGAVYNVKAYGAVGDGTTDDSAAINSAITAAGGGRVYFPAHTFYVAGTITVPANNWLDGPGTLSLATAANVNITGSNVTITRLTFSGGQGGAGTAQVYSQGNTNTQIRGTSHVGGGLHQIFLNTCTSSVVSGTVHSGTYEQGIYLYSCSSSTVEGFHFLPTVGPVNAGANGCVQLNACDHCSIIGGTIATGIDFSKGVASFGVGVSASTFCTVTGTTITGMLGADGLVLQASSTDIDIIGVNSSGNGNAAGAGTNYGTGDGFDCFNSQRVRVSGCTFRNNGNYASNRHINLEIFSCSDVTVSATDCSDGGSEGVGVIGTPDCTLIGVTSRRNYQAGVLIQNSGATQSTNCKIIGGEYTDNGQGNGATGTVEGIYAAAASTGQIIGVHATDTRAGGSKTQTYGLRLENTARMDVVGLVTDGANKNGGLLDSVGTSTVTQYNDGFTGRVDQATSFTFGLETGGPAGYIDSSNYWWLGGGSGVGLRVKGGDTSNTIYQTTGNLAVSSASTLTLTGTNIGVDTSGNLDVKTAGAGLKVAEGANAKQGTATLVAGTVTVANTSVTANSRIFLTTNTPGGTPGWLQVSARVAGTSFTILSSNALDTSVVAYELFEPG